MILPGALAEVPMDRNGETMENQERPAARAAKLMAEALGTRTGIYDLVRPCCAETRVDKPSGLQKP